MADLSKVEKEVYASMIKDYTTKKNGEDFVKREDLIECLQVLGCSFTPDAIEILVRLFDENGDSKLQVSEIIDNLDVIHEHSVWGDELMDCFKKLDYKNDGYIREHELYQILTMEGPNKMSIDEARTLVAELKDQFEDEEQGQGPWSLGANYAKFKYRDFVRIIIKTEKPEEQIKAQSILQAEFDKFVAEQQDAQQQQE